MAGRLCEGCCPPLLEDIAEVWWGDTGDHEGGAWTCLLLATLLQVDPDPPCEIDQVQIHNFSGINTVNCNTVTNTLKL